MDQPSPSAHLTSIHGGHVALLLGLVFLILYTLQPFLDPTPENKPTQRHISTDGESTQIPRPTSEPIIDQQGREQDP